MGREGADWVGSGSGEDNSSLLDMFYQYYSQVREKGGGGGGEERQREREKERASEKESVFVEGVFVLRGNHSPHPLPHTCMQPVNSAVLTYRSLQAETFLLADMAAALPLSSESHARTDGRKVVRKMEIRSMQGGDSVVGEASSTYCPEISLRPAGDQNNSGIKIRMIFVTFSEFASRCLSSYLFSHHAYHHDREDYSRRDNSRASCRKQSAVGLLYSHPREG